jgi:hypothetical protein
MLYTFGFEQSCVAVGDVFFIDPNPGPGQEGAEAGVRIELRRVERRPLHGSVYSSQPIEITTPMVRVDLFESFPTGRGRRDRVHYHPNMAGWEPGHRVFDADLSAKPLEWLHERLSDVSQYFPLSDVPDADGVSARAGEIVGCIEALWDQVRSGALDPPEGWTRGSTYRAGWL